MSKTAALDELTATNFIRLGYCLSAACNWELKCSCLSSALLYRPTCTVMSPTCQSFAFVMLICSHCCSGCLASSWINKSFERVSQHRPAVSRGNVPGKQERIPAQQGVSSSSSPRLVLWLLKLARATRPPRDTSLTLSHHFKSQVAKLVKLTLEWLKIVFGWHCQLDKLKGCEWWTEKETHSALLRLGTVYRTDPTVPSPLSPRSQCSGIQRAGHETPVTHRRKAMIPETR